MTKLKRTKDLYDYNDTFYINIWFFEKFYKH